MASEPHFYGTLSEAEGVSESGFNGRSPAESVSLVFGRSNFISDILFLEKVVKWIKTVSIIFANVGCRYFSRIKNTLD